MLWVYITLDVDRQGCGVRVGLMPIFICIIRMKVRVVLFCNEGRQQNWGFDPAIQI
jgi:hypothetical protein